MQCVTPSNIKLLGSNQGKFFTTGDKTFMIQVSRGQDLMKQNGETTNVRSKRLLVVKREKKKEKKRTTFPLGWEKGLKPRK